MRQKFFGNLWEQNWLWEMFGKKNSRLSARYTTPRQATEGAEVVCVKPGKLLVLIASEAKRGGAAGRAFRSLRRRSHVRQPLPA